MNTRVKEELESISSDIEIVAEEETRMVVRTQKGNVLSMLSRLKAMGFNHLTLVSCVDWIEEEEFELIYILSPYMADNETYTDEGKLHVILKTRISREKPVFQTVTPIFPNAEPYERELHELFGVDFQGHKRLIPLLLEGEHRIPPFRKDFDTRKYVEEVYDSVPLVQD